jgi:hypothetical protein
MNINGCLSAVQKLPLPQNLNYDVAVTGDKAKPGMGKRTAGG